MKLAAQTKWEMARGEVCLWSLRCEQIGDATLAALRRALSHEEQAQANRFHFAKDRTVYIAAHALLRIMLAGQVQEPVRFRRNAWGKPEIDRPGNRVRFNLTHARSLAACAVTIDSDVGVDAEARDATVDCLALAEEFFAPHEVAQLRTMAEAERLSGFLRFWTLKEAFIKAVGRGLSMSLADFAFTLKPLSFSCHRRLGIVAREWRFRSLPLGDTHQMAVALHLPDGGKMVLHHRTHTPVDLQRAAILPSS